MLSKETQMYPYTFIFTFLSIKVFFFPSLLIHQDAFEISERSFKEMNHYHLDGGC